MFAVTASWLLVGALWASFEEARTILEKALDPDADNAYLSSGREEEGERELALADELDRKRRR